MVKVDDVDDFKTFGLVKPLKEEAFFNALTKLTKTLGCHGAVKGGFTPSTAKEKFSDAAVLRLLDLNDGLTDIVNNHHPHLDSTKRTKKSKS